MNISLERKVAIVTGASSGIGLAVTNYGHRATCGSGPRNLRPELEEVRTAVVAGAGPIGILSALVARARGIEKSW
jgi:threonine dehydrogenase-like Zn-dependent dehydrogenase